MTITDEIIDRLRELRRHAGLSARDLGARMGLSASAILHIETGRNRPPLATIEKWAEACGCRLDVSIVEAGAGATLLSPDARALIDTVARVAPKMPPDALRAVRAMLAFYEREG